MGPLSPPRAQIAIRAERQLGHLTRAQLLGLGATPGWIRSQVRRGLLIPVHAGVYAVGHVPQHARARATAAVLACGDGAALSHAAAAALWGVGGWPATLEVSAPTNHRRPGLTTHRSRTLTTHEIRIHQGVVVTSPVRTMLDLQARLADPRLIRMVNDLRLAGRLRETAFAELCGRSRRIDRLLGEGDERADGADGAAGWAAPLTRSELEDAFRTFVTRHRLPMPEINALLPESGREVDALYRDARLIVEVDSWRFHRDRTAFERDRATDARALADRYRTLRTTSRRLRSGGRQEATTIRQILATPG